MKTVGILTFHNADNYGAVLQVFALTKTIQNLSDDLDVKVIDYRQDDVTRGRPRLICFNLKNPVTSVVSMMKFFWKKYQYYSTNAKIRRKKFKSFRKNFLLRSINCYTSPEQIDEYDMIVVGSDQVWNTSITNADSSYYLDFCPNSKKISYAASFGHSQLNETEVKYVRKFLPYFNSISVREDSAVKAVCDLIGLQPFLALDPVLLLTKKKWEVLFPAETPFVEEKYLLIYALELNKDVYKIASEIAQTLNIKIVEIGFDGFKRRYQHRDIIINTVGPDEFISLFTNAEFVVTNSFHGTAFSVLFEKNFYSVPHLTRGVRMVSLLNMLGLNHRIARSVSDISYKIEELNIDYIDATAKLEQERKNSIQFLQKALLNE